tara:strand:+ start:276 stop:476 length:201 start_codon:yes stop_codon:yes gene_type:complete
MNLSAYHNELQTVARKRLTHLGHDQSLTKHQLDEIVYVIANDMLSAIDSGIDKYTDEEWRAINAIN